MLFLTVLIPFPVVTADIPYQVDVIESKNDGSLPAGCFTLNAQSGGIAEVSIDLNGNGDADICLGSSSNTCDAGFDCAQGTDGTMCSRQQSH